MIRFSVSRAEYTEFRKTGALTIVRGVDKPLTEKFNTELGASFTTAKKQRTAVEPQNYTCQIRLQNVDEATEAKLESVRLDLDHLGKWKYMIALSCEAEEQSAPEPAEDPVQNACGPQEPDQAECPVQDACETKTGSKLKYVLIAAAALLAVLVCANLFH